MSATPTALEPEHPLGDAFVDAVLGVERAICHLGEALDDSPTDDATLAAGPDLLLDALLGLASLRKTIALILAAAASDLADVSPPADAAWHRELLR